MIDSALCSPTVLVVDDSADTADLIAMLLEDYGYAAAPAYSGAQGLSMARETHPDVVILDIDMPDMSGLELCRLIRSEPWGTDARIIVMSGWAGAHYLQASKSAGCDSFLMKPASLSQLLEAVRGNVPGSALTRQMSSAMSPRVEPNYSGLA